MKCKYAVSFEFSIKNPITVRGEVRAMSARTLAARALDEATIKEPGLKWSSIVILLERISEEFIEETVQESES